MKFKSISPKGVLWKRCSKISQNSQENTCVGVSFLIMLQAQTFLRILFLQNTFSGCFWKWVKRAALLSACNFAKKKKRRRHKFDWFKGLVRPSFSPEHLLATAFEPLKHINKLSKFDSEMFYAIKRNPMCSSVHSYSFFLPLNKYFKIFCVLFQ